MATELHVPVDLRQAKESAISGFLSGARDTEAEAALKRWVLSDDAYAELADGDDPIAMLCDLTHTDTDIQSQLGLRPTHQINDADRVQYAIEMMTAIRDDSSATYVDARLLTDSKGRSVYVGLSSFAAGQGGMQWGWLGLHKSIDALFESLENDGYAVDSLLPTGGTFDDYSDKDLANLMRKSVS
jgi:hypothetical protein